MTQWHSSRWQSINTVAAMSAMIFDKFDNAALAHAEQGYREAGLSPMRFRWDICYSAISSKWICDNIYTLGRDFNDNHIDTVLRDIMRRAGLRWSRQIK